jgi:L-fucose mutarotase
MLKAIDPLLGPELLHTLRAMGHGDDLALVDANFPAESIAAHTKLGYALRLDGADIPRAAAAILSVMPLDSFVEAPARRMEVMGEPDTIRPVHQDMQAAVDTAEGRSWPLGSIERFAFYEEAKGAFAVVATGDARGYGCFLLKKGVILAD